MEQNVTRGDDTERDIFPIAGIGGLSALQCFLAVLPKEFGFAVVFMQHLSPKHEREEKW